MNKKRIVLGITGGIASGKSTVMSMLAKKGIPGISSDVLAHRAISKGTPTFRKIVKRYGPCLIRHSGQLCRTKLGKIVFRDPAERLWLEKQVHPEVIRELKRFVRQHKGVIALDIPLLFEARLQHLVDQVVVVYASPAVQIQRLKKRSGLSTADARHRLSAQMPLSRKASQADFVLRNSGSLVFLRKQVYELLSKI